MKTHDTWTPAQEAVLKKHWPDTTPLQAIVALVNDSGPERTPNAVQVHANVMGLHRPPCILRRHRAKLCARKEALSVIADLPKETRPDGTVVTLCPPAHAYGAYRADSDPWSGWIYKTRPL